MSKQEQDKVELEEELLDLLIVSLDSDTEVTKHKAEMYMSNIDAYLDNLSRDTLDSIIDDIKQEGIYAYTSY